MQRFFERRGRWLLILALACLGLFLASSLAVAQTNLCKACFWDDGECFTVADGFGYNNCGLQWECTTIHFPNGDSSTFCFWKCRQSNPCVLPPG